MTQRAQSYLAAHSLLSGSPVSFQPQLETAPGREILRSGGGELGAGTQLPTGVSKGVASRPFYSMIKARLI